MSDIQGMDKLMRRLERMKRGAGLRKGIGKACETVKNAAAENCPVDTAELKGSIKAETPGPNDEPVGIVGTNKEYGPYVELGTGLFAAGGDGRHKPWSYKDIRGKTHYCIGQEPQPFLQPALWDNEANVRRLIAEGVKKDAEG